MRYLAVVRHGEYNDCGDNDEHNALSHHGEEQIAALAEKLKALANGSKAALMTSPALRAKQSAAIIGKKLDIVAEEHLAFWTDRDHHPDIQDALSLIKDKESFDFVIIVAHLEYSSVLPCCFGPTIGAEFRIGEIKKGNARVIDCHTKTESYLSWQN